MSFEQTAIFYNLVKSFKQYGEEIRNESGREQKASDFARRFARMHGEQNIKKVCAKANQALKAKIFTL